MNKGRDPQKEAVKNPLHNFSLRYDVKKRRAVGNTSMDAELSLFMTNIAKVTKNSFVFDPFVGTGSMLLVSYFLTSTPSGFEILNYATLIIQNWPRVPSASVVNLLAAGGIKSDTQRSFSLITFFILNVLTCLYHVNSSNFFLHRTM